MNRILFHATSDAISLKTTSIITGLITFVVAWLVAYKNPSVLDIIESIGGPILAIILYLMPLYAIYKFPKLAKYKHPVVDIFVLIFGLLAISTAIYKLF